MSDYLGTYKALVVNNGDPYNLGRVICVIPKVLGQAQSGWIEPNVQTAATPQVGDVVYVNFMDGDLSRGIYHGLPDAPAFPTADRPLHPRVGSSVFDITLGIPIWWNGTHWVNASGATV